MPHYFLIQLSITGFQDMLHKNRYLNKDWRKKAGDSAQGKINIGDYLIIYFTNRVPVTKKQIKYIYRVINIKNNNIEIYIKPEYEIKPLLYHEIIKLTDNNHLDKIFRNCGKQGFNIIQLSKVDYQKIYSRKRKYINSDEVKNTYALYKKMNRSDMLNKLNIISDINLLIYYSDNLSEVPSSVQSRLIREKLLEKKYKNTKITYQITLKGKNLIEKYKSEIH